MLDEADVGHRVVVRARAGDGPQGRPLFTDVLGELLSVAADHVVVRRADGSERTVARHDVAAAKRIGPRPARYSEIEALERAADAAWPAPVHERLGGWYLRAAEGFTNRGNSALPLGDPGAPLDEAIDACVAWYRRRGLTPRLTVPLPLARRVADALVERGWLAQPLVLVQTARLPPAVPPDPGVRLLTTPSTAFLDTVGARKATLPPSAHHLLTAVPDVRFAEIRDGAGALVACARGALTGAGEWLHLGLVEVAPGARRQGLGRRISLALFGWARAAGAERSMLQVEAHNDAAVTLYARLGYTTHHRYVTYAYRDGAR